MCIDHRNRDTSKPKWGNRCILTQVTKKWLGQLLFKHVLNNYKTSYALLFKRNGITTYASKPVLSCFVMKSAS